MTAPAGTTGAPARRWPAARGQGLLLGASLLIVLGSFLPWVSTPVGNLSGMLGAGIWTFYAGVLGIAGALVPRRTPALAQAAVVGLAATALPLWQLGRLVALAARTGAGVQGSEPLRLLRGLAAVPGTGLLLVLAGGVLALLAAHRLLRG